MNSTLSRGTYDSVNIENSNYINCKMFMFTCFNSFFNNVKFDKNNLTLSKFINCSTSNTEFMKSNKLLCVYKKNVMEN